MKKFLLIMLAAVLLSPLSACGKEDSRKEEEAQLDAVSESINGTLIKYTGSEISIETEDGKTLTFDNCYHAELQLKNGIVAGNDVVLVYVGAMDGTNTEKVRVRKIIVSDDNSDVYSLAQKTKEQINSLNGRPASGRLPLKAGQDEPESGVYVSPENGTGTISGNVNVRADALGGSEILGTLSSGDSVTVTGICENGWYRIVFEGQTGFVWQDFISY